MLRHTQSDRERTGVEPVPAHEAARVRITPEELIQAMAAIEARREREARERDGTIAIGEAVQELGLDATPEEILAAVQSQRSRQVRPVLQARRFRPLYAAVAALSLCFAWTGIRLVRTTTATAELVSPAPTTPAPPVETPPAEAILLPATGDLDGDGRVDIIIRKQSSHE